MSRTKPISDLNNYAEVLNDVSAGVPVVLMVSGRGRYVIMDIDDYEKAMAVLKFFW